MAAVAAYNVEVANKTNLDGGGEEVSYTGQRDSVYNAKRFRCNTKGFRIQRCRRTRPWPRFQSCKYAVREVGCISDSPCNVLNPDRYDSVESVYIRSPLVDEPATADASHHSIHNNNKASSQSCSSSPFPLQPHSPSDLWSRDRPSPWGWYYWHRQLRCTPEQSRL